MKPEPTDNSFPQCYLDSLMPEIDDMLKKGNIEISHRPLHATNFFMKNFVESIEGFDKESIDNPMFVSCLNHISDWYEDKYGLIPDKPQSKLTGVVFIHEQPYKLFFPYSISIDEGDEEQSALYFPIELHKVESWKNYVINSPSFEKMEKAILVKTKNDTGEIISTIRNIFHSCISINIQDDTYAELAKSIPTHINTASNLLCENSGTAINNTLWNLHIASEKALKTILYQQSGSFKRTHDLLKLLNDYTLKNKDEIELLLDQLPNHSDVIQKRYEPCDFKNSFAFKKTYLNYLDVIHKLSDHFENKFLAKDATIYMKKSKFAGARFK